MPTIQSVPVTASALTLNTNSYSCSYSDTDSRTNNFYRVYGFSGERPTGLVVSECSPLTIYGKDVEGVQEHIDRYDEMCRSG